MRPAWELQFRRRTVHHHRRNCYQAGKLLLLKDQLHKNHFLFSVKLIAFQTRTIYIRLKVVNNIGKMPFYYRHSHKVEIIAVSVFVKEATFCLAAL